MWNLYHPKIELPAIQSTVSYICPFSSSHILWPLSSVTQERATNHKPIELSPPIALDCIASLCIVQLHCTALHSLLISLHCAMCNCNSIALQLQWVSLHKCCILLSCLESPLRTMRRFILLILNSHFQSHIMLHCIVLHYFALHCPLLCQVGLHFALDPTVILAPHQQCIEWCWITTYQACPITHPSTNTNWILPPLC